MGAKSEQMKKGGAGERAADPKGGLVGVAR